MTARDLPDQRIDRADGAPGAERPSNEIVVYWRPGCPFCSSLLRRLDRYEVPHRRVDIWRDPQAARRVRAVANGNETVPTVTIGSAVLVNPDIHRLLAAAEEWAPDAVPDSYAAPQPGRFARWIATKLGAGQPANA